MVERIRDISVERLRDSLGADYLDVWCDVKLKKQIEAIGGVYCLGRGVENFMVVVDGRYDIEAVAEEIRALVEGKGD